MSVHPTSAATNESGHYGDVYTLQHEIIWAFCFNDRAKAVDQDDFGLLLSVAEGEFDDGTGAQTEGAGADVIEGAGSDKIGMSATSS
jgi:hypothetical protein